MRASRAARVLVFAACATGQFAGATEPAPDVQASAVNALGANLGVAVVARWQDGSTSTGVAAHGATGAASSLFEIGSLSKLFTGLLLAQAVEAGDLRIDQPLSELKPPGVSLDDHVGALTLRQLVTHHACLPSLPDDLLPRASGPDPYAAFTSDELWLALSRLRLPHAAPCEMAYSNWSLATVAEVLSLRYGESFALLVEERIARPLHMVDTSVATSDTPSPRLARGFDGDRPVGNWTFQAFAGAGGVRSTAGDLLLFGRAILAGRSGPLGAAAERFVTPLADLTGGAIGYAVMMHGPADDRLWFHEGQTAGYRAAFAIVPKANEVFVVLASNAQAPVSGAALALEASHFGVAAAREAPSTVDLAPYAGVFRIDGKLALTFVVQDGQLYGRLTGQSFNALAAAGGDVFVLAPVGAEFDFHRTDGKVVDVELRQAGSRLAGRLTAQAAPTRALLDRRMADAFAGTYAATAPGGRPLRFHVVAASGQLAVKLDDQPMLPVFEVPGRPDHFRYDVVDAELRFERDAEQRVVGLVLHQQGELRAIRVDEPRAAP